MGYLDVFPPEAEKKLETLASGGMTAMIARIMPDRTGGFLYLEDREGNCLYHGLIGAGAPDPARTEKWQAFSKEKARRLASHLDHFLSFQSRDPDNNKWGGAIRLQNGMILSFSGLPEWADEVFCAALAYKMGWAIITWLNQALTISGNEDQLDSFVALLSDA